MKGYSKNNWKKTKLYIEFYNFLLPWMKNQNFYLKNKVIAFYVNY